MMSVMAQDMQVTLAGPRVETEGGDDYFYVDVLMYSNGGFKLGSGQLYVNYNTLAFGDNVFQNNNLEILLPPEALLSRILGAPPFEFDYYGDRIVNDNTSSRFSFSWQQDFSAGCLLENNANYYSNLLFTIKIKFLPGQSGLDPGVCLEDGINFIEQIFTACGPVDCNTADCYAIPGIKLSDGYYPCSDCRIVYSKSDTGPGSLKEALNCTIPGDTIWFSPGLRTDSILIVNNPAEINKDITVLAVKDLAIHVNGGQTNKVFDILAGNNVYIEGVHVITSDNAGSIGIHNKGNTTLNNVVIYYDSSIGNIMPILNESDLQIKGVTEVKEK